MDPSIFLAALGVIATLISPFIGIAAAKWFASRELNPVSATRKAALEGSWVGTGTQESALQGAGPFESKVLVRIHVSAKEIIGEFNWQYKRDQTEISLDMLLRGGFLYDRYLRLHYNNKTESAMNFGSAVLVLNAAGNTLSGRFVGFGSIEEGLISGSVELHKER